MSPDSSFNFDLCDVQPGGILGLNTPSMYRVSHKKLGEGGVQKVFSTLLNDHYFRCRKINTLNLCDFNFWEMIKTRFWRKTNLIFGISTLKLVCLRSFIKIDSHNLEYIQNPSIASENILRSIKFMTIIW